MLLQIIYYNKTNVSPLVSSEGTWAMQEGYGFNMSYTANFENGTLSYLLDEEETLKLFRSRFEPEVYKVTGRNRVTNMKFELSLHEILSGNKTNFDLLLQAAETIAIIEAEKISIETCSVVSVEA